MTKTQRKLLIGILTTSLAVAAYAAQGGSFKDKAGNMEVTRFKSWKVVRETSTRFKFTGVGSPKLLGKWRSQNLMVEASTLEAVVMSDSKNALALKEATMGGGVKITHTQNNKEAIVSAPTAKYNADKNEVQAEGGIKLDSDDQSLMQTIHATGASGTVLLSKTATQSGAVQAARFTGPVTMTMKSYRLQEVNGEQKRVPFTVSGSGDQLIYDAIARKISLIGHVKLSGDDPILSGAEVEAANAVLTLSEKGEIESIDFDGEPGKTVIKGGGSGVGGTA